jgi:hypothetical protein
MTSPLQVTNIIRARVANHLYVNKETYVDPTISDSNIRSKKARFHYAWKPDRAEAHRIKRLSKGYVFK